jgi:hypothetical protein
MSTHMTDSGVPPVAVPDRTALACGVVDTGGPDRAAYRAAGSPLPAPAAAVPPSGSCARCAAVEEPLVAVGESLYPVVGRKDRWVRPRGRTLCPPCAWVYRTADSRRTAHVITRDPDRSVAVDPPALYRVLSAPLPLSVAVLLPAGGRDVLPRAQWGHLSVSDTDLPWTRSDADAVIAMARLRMRGFLGSALHEVTPPMDTLSTLPMGEWERTFADWAVIDPWRTDIPRWTAALHATAHVLPRPHRPPSGEQSDER